MITDDAIQLVADKVCSGNTYDFLLSLCNSEYKSILLVHSTPERQRNTLSMLRKDLGATFGTATNFARDSSRGQQSYVNINRQDEAYKLLGVQFELAIICG